MKLHELCSQHLGLAADWWWVHDFENDQITVSEGVTRSLGYRPEELSSPQAWASVVHETDLTDVRSASESALNSAEPTEVRLRYRTKGGSWKTLLSRMRPVVEEGVPLGLVGICREIDDVLAIEQEMLQRHEDLAQVASVLSHDFRGPARHIAGCTERVIEQAAAIRRGLEDGLPVDEDFDALGNWADLAHKGADRLGRMIEHVLQYSRAGTKGIKVENVDVSDVMDDVLRDYADRIDERHVSVRVRTLPTVMYDPTMLYLILANLVSNAIKFSKKDDPEPVVYVEGRDTSMDMASITVRDSGIGIPTSQQQKILEMGFRLHHESDYAGFGYGLAIVRRILNRCGGQLGIRSKEGEGSEFVVTLPAGRMVTS